MKTRAAILDDLGPLTTLLEGYRQFYRQPADPNAARHFLEQRFGLGDSFILVSEDEQGELTGFVQLFPGLSTVGLNRRWTLNDLFVAEPARGKGVGRALMQAAGQLAREHGVARIVLMTQRTNERAQRLYESLGWQRNTDFYSYLLDIE